jgi:hypothetical protein
LEHPQIAKIEGTARPDWCDLEQRLRALPVGRDAASDYENLIEEIMSAVFYPSLCRPTKQHQIHQGRKRIDITYANEARTGFFAWLSRHFPSALVFVECKNYGREIGNPELDQIAGRFSPSRGQFGLIVCRSVEDQAKILASCRDTAQDRRGFIVVLTDDDIFDLIKLARLEDSDAHEYEVIRRKFTPLIE